MRERPSARLLVTDRAGAVLLFRFRHGDGAGGERDYWATPGGALEPGESFAQAARRELAEETGFTVARLSPPVAERRFVLTLPDGDEVWAVELFYHVTAPNEPLSRDGWSEHEHKMMIEHRWWPLDELARTMAEVYPDDIPAILTRAGAALRAE